MPQDRPDPPRESLAKAERLAVFFRDLAAAPAAASFDEAIALLSQTLLAVEDRLSGIDRGAGIENDGRMYPAREDNRHSVAGHPDVARFRSRAHNTYVSSGGAILIVDLRGATVFSKPGSDGKAIEL